MDARFLISGRQVAVLEANSDPDLWGSNIERSPLHRVDYERWLRFRDLVRLCESDESLLVRSSGKNFEWHRVTEDQRGRERETVLVGERVPMELDSVVVCSELRDAGHSSRPRRVALQLISMDGDTLAVRFPTMSQAEVTASFRQHRIEGGSMRE